MPHPMPMEATAPTPIVLALGTFRAHPDISPYEGFEVKMVAHNEFKYYTVDPILIHTIFQRKFEKRWRCTIQY